MSLLIDIGNSRIKWVQNSAGVGRRVRSFDYRLDTLVSLLDQEFVSFRGSPSFVYVSNVAGEKLESIIDQWAVDRFGVKPIFAVSHQEKCGLISAYIHPEQLGVDRFLAMIGARLLFDQALVVVDCGTATTVDSVNSNGVFIGGLILPGLDLMRDSLFDGANALELPHGSEQINVFSVDTKSAILSGTVLATVGVIERAVKKLQKIDDSEIKCVVTGGNGEVVQSFLEVEAEYYPDLVLKGLSEYFRIK